VYFFNVATFKRYGDQFAMFRVPKNLLSSHSSEMAAAGLFLEVGRIGRLRAKPRQKVPSATGPQLWPNEAAFPSNKEEKGDEGSFAS
jgi:hypothetical protein